MVICITWSNVLAHFFYYALSKDDLCFHQDAYNESETFKKEKEEVLVKLSDMERRLSEGKGRINKLEQDNEKLRRALEQSMTRLNRMSLDSDNYVDRWDFVKPWKIGFLSRILHEICLMILTLKLSAMKAKTHVGSLSTVSFACSIFFC